ncbi:hypothetical protein ACQVP2_08225 [Methylobacterium aquaticum]|jgi:hypothetical protein|uniref:Uncharacterized protein n=1 Tax=Methylobacterium aquaticum TaxID=270351 RepID=A0A0J6S6Y9_9HYPH|nr:hypothetical protein [Methylobacterium aquaticum]KMO29183.1 hypothetical protein VP06_25150 [Methylobacterium aquaticum]
MAITGRFNFRKTLTGKLVLQVETERRSWWPFGRAASPGHVWRDATPKDLTAVELQPLLSLRRNPGYMPRNPVIFMMGQGQKEAPSAEVVTLAAHRAAGQQQAG